MTNTILLIDGSSFIFRAFYAIRNLSAPDGTPTNAIYGVINMLKQMQKTYTTPYWVCVFDAKGKTFRDDIYPQYKATRRETPAELIQQIPYIHEIIQDLGIPVIIQEGVEADDIIATIAKKYAALDYKVIIATGDKDFAQIVNRQITLVNTMTGEQLDSVGVEKKFGVKPNQIIDYLSLIGDSVDNVPGVAKCGPKTAQKWLHQYGSIANLILNQNQLSGAVGANFRAAGDWLATAQRLITIDCNVIIKNYDINVISNLSRKTADYKRLLPVFSKLNFRTWRTEAEAALNQETNLFTQPLLNLSTSVDLNPSLSLDHPIIGAVELTANADAMNHLKLKKPLQIIQDKHELQELIKQIIQEHQTTAFNFIQCDYINPNSPLCYVLIISHKQVNLIPLAAEYDLLKQPETKFNCIDLLDYWNATAPKICYNLKAQLRLLNNNGVQLQAVHGDLALASYIENSLQSHELNTIIHRANPDLQLANLTEILGKGTKRISFTALPKHQQQEYLLNLHSTMLETHQAIVNKLSPAEQNLYYNVELPLSTVLYQIETAGMLIDTNCLLALAQELRNKLEDCTTQIHQLAHCVFNLNSPKQMQEVLFGSLKIPTTGIKKLVSGFSTDEESLAILADSGYVIASHILKYRYLNKLLTTYVDKLPNYADQNGLIHTSLEQIVVASGRLSSKDPNLQNIPVRNEYGQAIRSCFIAKPGYKLVAADYSQIELRVLAHICQDQNLIAAFKSGADIHSATASQIFGKPLKQINKEERRYAKTINFGLIYGKSVFGLAKELKIERNAAKIYIDNYFAQFPQVLQYMEQVKQEAHQNGYVQSIYGRKIYLDNINSHNAILRQAEERLALNAPMQSSAADIIKIAMLNVNRWLKEQDLSSAMVLQIHDELLFQVPESELTLVKENLGSLMTQNINLAVPLIVDITIANNWGNTP
jgi:DNA polymerase-1